MTAVPRKQTSAPPDAGPLFAARAPPPPVVERIEPPPPSEEAAPDVRPEDAEPTGLLLFGEPAGGGGAVFSPDRRYRYRLERDVRGEGRAGCVAFVLLNPSTAGATIDDATVRRLCGFARRWGYARLVVVNLFAFVATDPRDLARAEDPVGPENDAHITAALAEADLVVCGWGAFAWPSGRPEAAWAGRAAWLLGAAAAAGKALHAWGANADGSPKHPVRLASVLTPVPWAPPAASPDGAAS